MKSQSTNWKPKLQEAMLYYNLRCYEGSGILFVSIRYFAQSPGIKDVPHAQDGRVHAYSDE